MLTQNQVRQFYVANAVSSGLTTAGDINVETSGNDMYFNVVNADGEVMRTDLVNKNKIKSVTFTPAEAMEYTSKATYIKLSEDALDTNGKPIAGQDYILNIKVNQLNWPSDSCPGWKYGVVHTISGTNNTTSNFYKTLAKSLSVNMSRDAEKLMKVYCVNVSGAASSLTTSNVTEITKDSDIPTGTVYAVLVDEAEQPWKLGAMNQEAVNYEAKGDNIIVSGEEIKWSEETVIPGFTKIQDGKKIADMEWFYHGERGDIYREGAWPNNWANQMLANKNTKYDTVDIHYYWNGANHASQLSEKDITIACPATTGGTQVATTLISAIKTAADITDADLTGSGSGVQTTIIG